MRRNCLAFFFAFLAFSLNAQEVLRPTAFFQITGEAGEGTRTTSKGEGLKYGTDRVRAGYKFDTEKYFGKFIISLEKTDSTQQNELPEVIQDVYLGMKFGEKTKIRVGQYKTPLGMDFHQSGSDLNITKRGIETQLTLNRSLGLMIERKLSKHLALELGHFNPSKRSNAVIGGKAGTHSSVASRLKYLPHNKFHVELAYGNSGSAGGTETSDYHVFDIGLKYFLDRFSVKFEYINGLHLQGVQGDRQEAAYLHMGYHWSDHLELILRPYYSQARIAGVETDLQNTFLGINLKLEEYEKVKTRFQLNYVLATGDKNQFTGLGGYTANALLSMLQFSY